jgi:oxygen-independent coproporphyrinogen-3 oxidase
MDRYVRALLVDVRWQIQRFGVERVPTVYIGGGTPSVLGASRIARLLQALIPEVSVPNGPPREITVEANPETASAAFLAACKENGVTRVSAGVQSFSPESRAALGRAGAFPLPASPGVFVPTDSPRRLLEHIARIAEAFPGAFSLDLMTGIPLRDRAGLLEDIRTALDFKPAHVSLYSLTLAPDTPLGRAAAAGGSGAPRIPNRDDADADFIAGRDALVAAGYPQYEIANFAPAGNECRHNIRYWRMENWLGAGAGASGTIINERTGAGIRCSYPANIPVYLDIMTPSTRPSLSVPPAEALSRADLIKESLLMGFRYHLGPDAPLFARRFRQSIEDTIPETLSRWRTEGRLSPAPLLSLTPEGSLHLNAFLLQAFAEIDRTSR